MSTQHARVALNTHNRAQNTAMRVEADRATAETIGAEAEAHEYAHAEMAANIMNSRDKPAECWTKPGISSHSRGIQDAGIFTQRMPSSHKSGGTRGGRETHPCTSKMSGGGAASRPCA